MRHDTPGTREDLARLFAARNYRRGAEIGVERGLFAERLCQLIPGVSLVAVDAWEAYPGYREHVTQAKIDGFYVEAQARLQPYGAHVVKARSVDAAAQFRDQSFDFVYLDANHAFLHVATDLAAWLPKVRRGGIIAGHDYRRVKGRGLFHVKHVIDAYTHTYAIDFFVLRGDRSPTWYWEVA